MLGGGLRRHPRLFLRSGQEVGGAKRKDWKGNGATSNTVLSANRRGLPMPSTRRAASHVAAAIRTQVTLDARRGLAAQWSAGGWHCQQVTPHGRRAPAGRAPFSETLVHGALYAATGPDLSSGHARDICPRSAETAARPGELDHLRLHRRDSADRAALRRLAWAAGAFTFRCACVAGRSRDRRNTARRRCEPDFWRALIGCGGRPRTGDRAPNGAGDQTLLLLLPEVPAGAPRRRPSPSSFARRAA